MVGGEGKATNTLATIGQKIRFLSDDLNSHSKTKKQKKYLVLQLLLVQSLLICLTASAFFLYHAWSVEVLLAGLYGGAMALLNTLLLSRRLRKVTVGQSTPQADVFAIYFGAVERFILALVGMALGMGWLALYPPALLATFMVAQIAYPIMAGRQNNKQMSSEFEMRRTS